MQRAVRQPRMGRAGAGAGIGGVVVRIVGRRHGAVAGNDRRAGIGQAEENTGDGEFEMRVVLDQRLERRAGGPAGGAVLLDRRADRHAADRIRETAGKRGVALGDRPALRLVAVDQAPAAPAGDRRGQLPA